MNSIPIWTRRVNLGGRGARRARRLAHAHLDAEAHRIAVDGQRDQLHLARNSSLKRAQQLAGRPIRLDLEEQDYPEDGWKSLEAELGPGNIPSSTEW